MSFKKGLQIYFIISFTFFINSKQLIMYSSNKVNSKFYLKNNLIFLNQLIYLHTTIFMLQWQE